MGFIQCRASSPISIQGVYAHSENPNLMKSQEIAQRWIDFFVKRGHTHVPSASLVSNDPSLLFTVAGMVPFIPYLTAVEPAPYPRAVSVQKLSLIHI